MKRKMLIGLSIILFVLIFIFAIPIIINESFKVDNGYLVTWTAADILAFYGALLSFIGATILGAVALYQNKKFQIENDKAQTRLENINNRISDSVTISVIVEYESRRVDTLEKLLNAYEETSNVQKIGIGLSAPSSLYINVAKVESEMDILSTEIAQEFRRDNEVYKAEMHPLKISFFRLHSNIKDILEISKDEPKSELIQEKLPELITNWGTFVKEKQKYLISQRQKIDNALYGEFTLAEIKKMFINRVDKF